MKISINWLKLYIEEIDNSLLIDIINNNLVNCGFEIEEQKYIKPQWEGLIIGKLISLEILINTKKLKKCIVFDGEKNLQVLCGGDDLIVNELYVFAPIGSKIGDINITPRNIQGETSNGMLCSYGEIGIQSIEQMARIENNVTIGTPLEKVYPINLFEDYVFNIKITPNRSDCLSVMGILRELVACSKGKIKIKENIYNNEKIMINNNNTEDFKKNKNIIEKTNITLKIQQESYKQLNYFYTAVLENVENFSPLWLKILLNNIGTKSRYLPVDVSNFLMYKYGQPTHVYDYDYILKNKINMEINLLDSNKDNSLSIFEAIDGKNYNITDNTLVMMGINSDKSEILSVIGIIGGNTSAYNGSGNILIEIAGLNEKEIRNSMNKCKIYSEAAYRFSRWVDPLFIGKIMQEFGILLSNQNFPSTNDNDIFINNFQSISFKNYISTNYQPLHYYHKDIFLSYGDFYRTTGFALSIEEQINILKSLNFDVEYHTIAQNHKDELNESTNNIIGILVKVPKWRIDIQNSQDIIDEIIRINGVNQYKTIALDNSCFYTNDEDNNKNALNNGISLFLAGLNYYEVINYPFIDKEEIIKNKNSLENSLVKIVSEKNSIILRQSCLFNLVENWKYIKGKSLEKIQLFEIGERYVKENIHDKNDKCDPLLVSQINEENIIAGLYYDNNASQINNFNIVKNHIKTLIIAMGGDHKLLFFIDNPNYYLLHKNKSTNIVYKNNIIGYLGVLNSNIEINSKCILWEILDLSFFLQTGNNILTKYPIYHKKIHLSLEINNKDIDIIEKIKGKLYNQFNNISEINVIDYFNLNDNNSSYTIEISWKYHNENDDITKLMINNTISEYLINECNIKVR